MSDTLVDLQTPLGSTSSHFGVQDQGKSELSPTVTKGSLRPFGGSGSSNSVVLSIGNMDGSEFVNMVSRPSFVLKSSALGRSSISNGSGAAGRGGINWRDFYQDGGGEPNMSMAPGDGVSGQGVLRGNKFDFGQIQHQSGTLSPRKSVSGGAKASMPSTSEYLRINQAYVASQVQQREQQLLSNYRKVNEQRDGVVTTTELLSIGSTPLTPRPRSATYKRPSSQLSSPRFSNTGAQYNYSPLELSGTRVSDSPAVEPRLRSLSISPNSNNNNSHSPDRQSSIQLSPRHQQPPQLSPRLSRIHHQHQSGVTTSLAAQLADGLLGITITSAQSQPASSTSSSPPKSPRRSADGTSLSVSPGRVAPLDTRSQLELSIGAHPSPRPGVSHEATTSAATALPVRQQHQPSMRKMSQRHPHHQFQQLQQPEGPSRKSMLVDSSRQIQQQVQQQFGAGGLEQLLAQSVPISPRKQ